MTDEMMALRGLMEKRADADLLREMIGFVAERLVELKVSGLTGAAHCERCACVATLCYSIPTARLLIR